MSVNSKPEKSNAVSVIFSITPFFF